MEAHLLSAGIQLRPGPLNLVPESQNGLLVLITQHARCFGARCRLHGCIGELGAPLYQLPLIVCKHKYSADLLTRACPLGTLPGNAPALLWLVQACKSELFLDRVCLDDSVKSPNHELLPCNPLCTQ